MKTCWAIKLNGEYYVVSTLDTESSAWSRFIHDYNKIMNINFYTIYEAKRDGFEAVQVEITEMASKTPTDTEMECIMWEARCAELEAKLLIELAKSEVLMKRLKHENND